MKKQVYIVIDGKPVGKGRPRFTRTGHSFTPEQTREYEEAVRKEYLSETEGLFSFGPDVPIRLAVTAYYPIAKSNTKVMREAKIHNLVLPHLAKPDLDNVVKIVSDALNGTAFHDDTQIVEIFARKRYSERPRVEITLSEAETA